jgi:pimeloyl-ACP methyl ester carboxylesterase
MTAHAEQRTHSFTCRLGRPLSYITAGSGPDLVIVNAYGIETKLWDRLVDLLAHDFRVIIWDMRGFKPNEHDLGFTLMDHVDDLLEILERAATGPVHMLAYCSGAKLALATYGKAASRIRSLAFVGGNFWPLAGYGKMKCSFATNLHSLALMIKRRPFMAGIVARMMTSKILVLPMVAENRSLIPEEYRDLVVAPFASKGSVATYTDLVLDFFEIDTTAYLDAVRVPTLMIGAQADRCVDPELSTHAAARIRGAQYLAVPEFNHFCMIEAPDKLAQIIGKFLGSLDDGVSASPVVAARAV